MTGGGGSVCVCARARVCSGVGVLKLALSRGSCYYHCNQLPHPRVLHLFMQGVHMLGRHTHSVGWNLVTGIILHFSQKKKNPESKSRAGIGPKWFLLKLHFPFILFVGSLLRKQGFKTAGNVFASDYCWWGHNCRSLNYWKMACRERTRISVFWKLTRNISQNISFL